MHFPTSFVLVLAGFLVPTINAAVPLYGQCGGQGHTGETTCVSGACCQFQNDYYSQCVPSGSCASATTTRPTTTTGGSTPTQTGLRGIHKLAMAKGRYFGTALDGIWNINNEPAYLALAGNPNEFGMMTPGNVLKWQPTEPTRNTFTFSYGDYMVNWGKSRGQMIRGHTFIWHSQLAGWVTSGNFNNATLISIIQNHIQVVGTRYKGQLYAWDVINEPWNEDGTWRSSVFYKTIGPEYPAIALRAARAIDPTAKLYINDYNVEGVNAKSTAMYNLASKLKAQGVPLDGIGLQAHLIVGSVPNDMQTNIQRFANLGLDVAITELDIRAPTPISSAKLTQQALDYGKVVKACVAVSRCVGITTWDTTDGHSWIPGVFPGEGDALLFDRNNKPKPAYHAVADALAAATVRGPL